MSFQIHSLPPSRFDVLFTLSNSELEKYRATKMIADSKPGYPCRVSLADAEIGETVILVNYEHQPADTPFKASHAIFIRENAKQSFPEVGMVPELFDTRLISIRAFNDKHFIVSADVVDGSHLTDSIPAILQDARVEYLHLHNAKLGCFLARVTRA